MKAGIELNINEHNVKKAARRLQERLADIGVELKLGQAYEALAAVTGDRDWPSLKSRLVRQGRRQESTGVAPAASLAEGLGHAVRVAQDSGALDTSVAERLRLAAQGDREAVWELAAACGHVPVVTIDAGAEAERWLKSSLADNLDLLREATGRDDPLTKEGMAQMAAEFAAERDYDRRAIGDFFSDWVNDEFYEKGLRPTWPR